MTTSMVLLTDFLVNFTRKMFSVHRLELFPFNWLYLSVWESAVYAKRFELSYINPIMPYLIGQYISGDLDDVVMMVTIMLFDQSDEE